MEVSNIMKRNKLYIMASMLLICSYITVTLPSCSKKAATTTTASNTQAPGNGQQFGGGNMSSRMKTGINALVSKGTITKAQGTKILAALTSQFGNRQGGSPSSQKPGTASGNAKSRNKPSGTRPSGGKGKGFGSSALSKLVTDKVITQKQADAVQKKLFSNMQGRQGGAPSQDSSSSDNSSQS